MKKILISILIILLLVLSYFALAKGISILNIKSVNGIKAASNKLENDFYEANNLSNKIYLAEVEALENAIKELKISKQKYESKNSYNTEENPLGTIEIKTYKIHYLWTILGNFRKNRGVQSLSLDLKSTHSQDVYDLQFTLVGSYKSITNFLYDIENDEELNFEIKNLAISSEIGSTSSTLQNDIGLNIYNNTATIEENNENTVQKSKKSEESKESKKSDGVTLQAVFTVENIGITLD